MLPFTVDALEAAVAAGDVTKRPHAEYPYFIYNYSPEVQFSKKWNDITRACRGLILDEDYSIVARPWEKFFNLGEVELKFQFTDPVEVMDKADGSLGILYPLPRKANGRQHYAVSTRGSFHSVQAGMATLMWNRLYASKYETILEALDEQYTFLFEIIYPSNRIVLDYGDMRDLILLGGVQNENGYYIGPQHAKSVLEWDGPVVETYNFANISEAIGSMGRKNKEGYVIRRNNFLVKIKEPDYLDLHRLVTNCTPRTIWEQLKNGKTESEIISAFPDEFHGMVQGFIDPLVEKFEDRYAEIMEGFDGSLNRFAAKSGVEEFNRGDYARFIAREDDKGYYFNLLDNRPIREVLWSSLKPTTD